MERLSFLLGHFRTQSPITPATKATTSQRVTAFAHVNPMNSGQALCPLVKVCVVSVGAECVCGGGGGGENGT